MHLLFVVMPMTTAPQLSLAPVSHRLPLMIEKRKSTNPEINLALILFAAQSSRLKPGYNWQPVQTLYPTEDIEGKSKSVDSRLDEHFHTCIGKGVMCLPRIVSSMCRPYMECG